MTFVSAQASDVQPDSFVMPGTASTEQWFFIRSVAMGEISGTSQRLVRSVVWVKCIKCNAHIGYCQFYDGLIGMYFHCQSESICVNSWTTEQKYLVFSQVLKKIGKN